MSNFILGFCFAIAVEVIIIIYLAAAGGKK